jgi:ketosteroid isomerase-like protein
MSRENVEIVRRLYEAVHRGDAETVLALYDPDVVWDFSESPIGAALELKIYRGHDGLRRWWSEWREAWEGYEDSYEDLLDAGDHVVAAIVSRGRGRASGAQVEWTQYGVWSFQAGKIVRVAWFGTREDALEAIGPKA